MYFEWIAPTWKSLLFFGNMKHVYTLRHSSICYTLYFMIIDDFCSNSILSLFPRNIKYIVVVQLPLPTFLLHSRFNIKTPTPLSSQPPCSHNHELCPKPQTHRPLPVRQHHLFHNLRTPLPKRLLLPRMPTPIRIRLRSQPRHPIIRHAALTILPTALWFLPA